MFVIWIKKNQALLVWVSLVGINILAPVFLMSHFHLLEKVGWLEFALLWLSFSMITKAFDELFELFRPYFLEKVCSLLERRRKVLKGERENL
jgi:hypothetical protein